MKLSSILTILPACFMCSLGFAQEVTGIAGFEGDATFNQQFVTERNERNTNKTNGRNVVVFIGDRVVPQFVDGGGWQTSMMLVNLENFPVTFDVLFFRDNGTDLFVPIVGQGVVRGMKITLPTAGSTTFATTGAALA